MQLASFRLLSESRSLGFQSSFYITVELGSSGELGKGAEKSMSTSVFSFSLKSSWSFSSPSTCKQWYQRPPPGHLLEAAALSFSLEDIMTTWLSTALSYSLLWELLWTKSRSPPKVVSHFLGLLVSTHWLPWSSRVSRLLTLNEHLWRAIHLQSHHHGICHDIFCLQVLFPMFFSQFWIGATLGMHPNKLAMCNLHRGICLQETQPRTWELEMDWEPLSSGTLEGA